MGDLETDNKLAAIRTAFSHCTVLTIAHRLDTVMDSDRIIVMEKGVVAEIDAPKTLLDNKDGVLSHLVSRSGNADRLKSIASKSFENCVPWTRNDSSHEIHSKRVTFFVCSFVFLLFFP